MRLRIDPAQIFSYQLYIFLIFEKKIPTAIAAIFLINEYWL